MSQRDILLKDIEAKKLLLVSKAQSINDQRKYDETVLKIVSFILDKALSFNFDLDDNKYFDFKIRELPDDLEFEDEMMGDIITRLSCKNIEATHDYTYDKPEDDEELCIILRFI